MNIDGRSIGLYGVTGSGKTTLVGEKAKSDFKLYHKKTWLYAADMGGFESIKALVKLGVVEIKRYDSQKDDPWIWIGDAVSTIPPPDVANVVFDSATSIGEAIFTHITKSDIKVGAQNTQKFSVTKNDRTIQVGITNQNHYGVVQTFMLDQIWKSTWLCKGGQDIIWTFSVDNGEDATHQQVAGPKLAGHALTSAVPKWFQYTFRTATEQGSHVLYLKEHDINGMQGFGNARYPLDAQTPLPDKIEPASLVEALKLIEQGQVEAEEALREELGL